MYLLGIHCLIPSFVLWNPEEFSSGVKETKETAVFRAEKDAKAIRDYLLGSILRKAPARKPGSGPRPSSFWEEDVQTSAPSTSRTRRVASVWQEHESDDDHGEEDYEEEEHDFESREQFHETAPRDRGKRPASTSTDTTTSAKKKRSAPSTSRGKPSTSRGQKSTRGRGRGRRGKHIFFSDD